MLDLALMLEQAQAATHSLSILGAVLGSVAGAVVGGLISKSSAKDTNQANERIAAQETQFNQSSAREANELTDRLSLRATKSTEAMTASALAQSQSQFEQSQAFNERMSNTAYTRGIRDLKNAGLNPILAATRGVTTSPTVSGGAAPAGSGTGGSGTAARASQFRRVDAGLQALNSAAALGRAVAEIDAITQANDMRRKYGVGSAANTAETIEKTSRTVAKSIPKAPKGSGKRVARKVNIYTKPLRDLPAKIKREIKSEIEELYKQRDRNAADRGPRSNYQLFGPPSRRKKR